MFGSPFMFLFLFFFLFYNIINNNITHIYIPIFVSGATIYT